jgi:transposase
VRAADQSDRRRGRIRDLEAMAEKMVTKLDAQDDGQTARGRRASDRGAYSRFTRAVAEAQLTRFLKVDLQADRFSYSVDEAAIARAELFDGKLALLTNAPDLTPAETVSRYKSLADIERGFRVLKSDIEIAPVHHRLPDRIRAHALISRLRQFSASFEYTVEIWSLLFRGLAWSASAIFANRVVTRYRRNAIDW